jgi:excisionase family DNA binding protein
MSGKQAKLRRKLDREKNKQSVASPAPSVRVAPVVVPKPELPSTQGNNLPSPPPPGAIPSEADRRREGSDSSILLTLVEVAKLLKVSQRTVQRLEKDQGLPGRVFLGRTVRYHREIIEKWILTRVATHE